MGEMAELAAEEYYLEKYSLTNSSPKKNRARRTEETLNSNYWINGYGEKLELAEMDKDYLQNLLCFIYRKRDSYWLSCRNVDLIEKYKDGDEFFQRVIRKSTLWTAILKTLRVPEESFNFEISE